MPPPPPPPPPPPRLNCIRDTVFLQGCTLNFSVGTSEGPGRAGLASQHHSRHSNTCLAGGSLGSGDISLCALHWIGLSCVPSVQRRFPWETLQLSLPVCCHVLQSGSIQANRLRELPPCVLLFRLWYLEFVPVLPASFVMFLVLFPVSRVHMDSILVLLTSKAWVVFSPSCLESRFDATENITCSAQPMWQHGSKAGKCTSVSQST